jgi:RNA polymerase sigma-70 factor (ECF subfamily)
MAPEDPESDLAQQAAAGDRAALSQLLLMHYDELKRHVSRRITADLQGVLRSDDVLQQTFVRVAQTIGSFQWRHAGSFRAWLETIADNLIRDAVKRRRRERRASEGVAERFASDGHSSVGALIDKVAGDSTAPGKRAERGESIRRLQAALAALPDEQREVIERYYLQGQSHEQIAAALDRTKDAVRGICYRARKNLRDLMGRSSLYFSG